MRAPEPCFLLHFMRGSGGRLRETAPRFASGPRVDRERSEMRSLRTILYKKYSLKIFCTTASAPPTPVCVLFAPLAPPGRRRFASGPWLAATIGFAHNCSIFCDSRIAIHPQRFAPPAPPYIKPSKTWFCEFAKTMLLLGLMRGGAKGAPLDWPGSKRRPTGEPPNGFSEPPAATPHKVKQKAWCRRAHGAMRKSRNTLQFCVNPIVAANRGPLANRLRPGGARGANKT